MARRLFSALMLLIVPLALTACSPRTATPMTKPTNGTLLRMTKVRNPTFSPAIPPGYALYSLTYESDGHPVQGYLGVPPGKGPFQLLVVLHGGYIEATGHPSAEMGITAADAADHVVEPALVVFMPNYRGYRPSPGDVQDGYQDYLDTLYGLRAVESLRNVHVAPRETYLEGGSLGGFVALRLAESDPSVRAVVLTSPWPGAEWALSWLNANFMRLDKKDIAFYDELQGMRTNAVTPWLRENSVAFSDLKAPILIIGGRQDQLNPPAMVEALASEIRRYDPHVTLDFVPGGHAPIGNPQWDDDFSDFMNHWGINLYVPMF